MIDVNQKQDVRHSGHSLMAGVVLITVGILFLLNNFGLLPWSVWSVIWRFWPLFLILAGLEMLLGDSWAAELIVGLITAVSAAFILIQIISANNFAFRTWMRDHMKWMPSGGNIFLLPRNVPDMPFRLDLQDL